MTIVYDQGLGVKLPVCGKFQTVLFSVTDRQALCLQSDLPGLLLGLLTLAFLSEHFDRDGLSICLPQCLQKRWHL